MKNFLNITVSLFLAVFVFSGCKKNSVEEFTASGSAKNGSRTSAIRTIYVSTINGDDASADPFNSSTPYKTINKAASITLPGDDVLIMNGTYTSASTLTNDPILNVDRSGAAGNYITYKAYPGHTPVLYMFGNKWNAVIIKASYIIVDGLEIKGDNPNINLADAEASYNAYMSGSRDWNYFSKYNTNGVGINGTATAMVHHIEVRNCSIHDFAGGGIGTSRSDYVTIDNNKVYNNSWFSMYANSGISTMNTSNFDTSTGYKMFITRNIVYNNYAGVKWISTQNYSDGNGIILDANSGGTNNGNAITDYTGRTLVENNISYLNGGGGVHLFQAQHVDVFNNTAYMNEQKLNYGNIDANQCKDSRFRNNIAYAKNGGKAQDMYSAKGRVTVTFDYNVYYNGTTKSGGANSIIANPQFTNAAAGDFTLQLSSPAINAGMTSSISGTTTDIIGNVRLKNGRIDAGAYEVN